MCCRADAVRYSALCEAGCGPAALRALLSAFFLSGPAILIPGDDNVSVAIAVVASYPPERPDSTGELATCLMEAALFPDGPVRCDMSSLGTVDDDAYLGEQWVAILESPWPVFGWAHAAHLVSNQCWFGDGCGGKGDPSSEMFWYGLRSRAIEDVIKEEPSFSSAFVSQALMRASI